jgi:hypothetical protein
MSLSSYKALCRSVGMPRRIEEEKGNISQLLTEFGLLMGINRADIN